MDQEQLAALLEEIGPERLLIIIQLLMQMSEQQIQQLVQELANLVLGGGGQPMTEEDYAAQEPAQDMGQQNIYGG